MFASNLRRLAVATLVLTLALPLAGCSGVPATSSAPTAAPSAAAEAYVADIDVGGHALHIVCVGPIDTGRPTVIFESGLGGELFGWAAVMGLIKATDRACSYERANVGQSGAAPKPRTTEDQVADLHALLEGAGIAAPIILVGHSLGGWNLMVYTDTYPDDVAGVVLVDIRPPAMSRRLLEELPPVVEGEPEIIHQSRVEFTEFETDPTRNVEGIDLRTSSDQALATSGFGDRPTVILWAEQHLDLWEGLDPDLAARMEDAYLELRGDVEATADDPEVIDVESDHFIAENVPDVVVDAIKSIFAKLGV